LLDSLLQEMNNGLGMSAVQDYKLQEPEHEAHGERVRSQSL